MQEKGSILTVSHVFVVFMIMILLGGNVSACAGIPISGSSQYGTIPTPDPAYGIAEFPLSRGTTWVYSYNIYEPAAADPSGVTTATYLFTETILDTSNIAPYFIAHIQRDQHLVHSDPDWQGGTVADSINEWWYVVKGLKIYESRQPISMDTLNVDILPLDFNFPLRQDETWCPFGGAGNSAAPDCNESGKTTVTALEGFETPAGSFSSCFLLTEAFNNGSIQRWFCSRTGIVAEKFDHSGTRFGYQKTLIGYSGGNE